MIIDFHTHFYPPKIVERALSAISVFPDIKPATDGTAEGLKHSMQLAGIACSVGLPLANTPDNVRGINRWAAAHNHYPVIIAGSIHPHCAEPVKMIEEIAALGLKGIKVHPEYQHFRFSETKLAHIWQACIDNDLFVLTHCGKDIAFSPPFHSTPRELREFHERFPQLKLVIAHLGGWQMWDEAEQYLIGAPVYLDTAFTSKYLPVERITAMIRRHGADRIIFGTDSPWQDQKQEVEFFRALPLSASEQSAIFYENAAKLLHFSVFLPG
jgi:predicted TIM-barrel fold metal-dependent hydrolase